jgi:hypothetical protein
MKNLIRISAFILIAFLSSTGKATAQTGPVECKIVYGYDVAGNRIQREYKCEATWMPWDPGPSVHPILSGVYPNPTSGVLTGVFSEPIGGEAGSALVSVSTMGGIIVFQQEYTQTITSFTIDISQQIPGQYLLTVAAFNQVESYVITKL